MSKKSVSSTILLILITAFASPVMASGYIGLGAGKSNIEGSSGVEDLKATSKKIFGGYRFAHFGIEAGYHDFGDMEYGLADYEITALELSAIGYISVAPTLDIFGKLGMLDWDSETRIETILFSTTISESGSDAIIGVGAQFSPVPSLILRAEAQKTELDEADTTLLTVGIGYTF